MMIAPKRTRYMNTINMNRDSLDSVFTDSYTTTLVMKDNQHIKHVRNCPILSTLQLCNTTIQTINTCPSLLSLTIEDSASINCIRVGSVHSINISNCRNLHIIDCQSAEMIRINMVPDMHQLKLPSAKSVKLISIDISKLLTCLSNIFVAVVVMKLKRCRIFNIAHELDGCSHLNILVLDTCNIETVDNISNIQDLRIINCGVLASVSDISNVRNIIITKCNKLLRVCQLTNVGCMDIGQCDNLKLLSEIDGHKLLIRYCFNLVYLCYVDIKTIVVDRCPSLVVIQLHKRTCSLVVDTCTMLNLIQIHRPNKQSNLRVKIAGDNDISAISGWHIDSLTIDGSDTICSIDNVSATSKIDISNCQYITDMTNIRTTELIVEQCQMLRTIAGNSYAGDIYIDDCESLAELNINNKYIDRLYINNCESLACRINASIMSFADINNSGIVLLNNLKSSTIVHIENVDSLPDTNATTTNALIERIGHVNKSIAIIARCLHRFIMRARLLKFKRFLEIGRLSDCVICQEPLYPNTTMFTPCDHVFHDSCMHEWMVVRRSCPLCNTAL